jgi:hypothetical protein
MASKVGVLDAVLPTKFRLSGKRVKHESGQPRLEDYPGLTAGEAQQIRFAVLRFHSGPARKERSLRQPYLTMYAGAALHLNCNVREDRQVRKQFLVRA